MIYQREHVASGRAAFDRWNEWVRNHQYSRSAMMGIGAFLNSAEGTLLQTRRALEPSLMGSRNIGVNFFSMATSNVAVTANPLSLPPGQNTPARPFADFAAGLVTGRSADGVTLFEDPVANPIPVFAVPAAIPDLAWKVNPAVGHLRGFVRDESGATIDTGAISIQRVFDSSTPAAGRTSIATASDGNGYYGGVDLAPGAYTVAVTPAGQPSYMSACTVAVAAGHVASFDVTVDRAAPGGSLTVDPATLWPPNGSMVTVTLTGELTDVGTGLDDVTFRVLDEYGTIQPAIPAMSDVGSTATTFSRAFELQASRLEEDRDGRTYTIEVVVTDRACNQTTLRTAVVVPHDRRR
jgi:hypothetical protein